MSDLNLDELLKLLEEEVSEKEQNVEKFNQDSCERFIQKSCIVKGLTRVPNYVIYYHYKKKYKTKQSEELWSKHHFFRLFNPHFEQKRTGKQRVYMLDGNSFDLTREGLLEAKKYDEEYKIKVKKARGTYKKRKRRKRVPVSGQKP